MRDRAGPDVDDLVGAVLAQASQAAGPYREADLGPPAQAVLVAGQRFHADLAVQARDPPQLLADDRGLELALGHEAGVLPVAPAAAAGVGVRARWLHPVGRGLQDLRRLGPREPRGDLGHPGQYPLPGQRVPDQDDPPARLPGHAPAPLGDLADVQFELVVARRPGWFHAAPHVQSDRVS
jgi:hypothetical protein